ncbi:MAG: bacteriocin [Bacteroidales bacterium]|nr:bacteriocin [Bacteroidales bacterium]
MKTKNKLNKKTGMKILTAKELFKIKGGDSDSTPKNGDLD